jgi:hypothetical protein
MLVGNEIFLGVLCILSKLFWFLFNFFFLSKALPLSVSASEIETLLGSLPVSEDSATVLCFFFFFLGGIPSPVAC